MKIVVDLDIYISTVMLASMANVSSRYPLSIIPWRQLISWHYMKRLMMNTCPDERVMYIDLDYDHRVRMASEEGPRRANYRQTTGNHLLWHCLLSWKLCLAWIPTGTLNRPDMPQEIKFDLCARGFTMIFFIIYFKGK